MASSWCTSSQAFGAGCGEHLSWAQTPCQSNTFWHVTDISPAAAITSARPAPVWGACKKACAGASTFVCGERGDDATSIFSPVHRVLPLCYAVLFLGQAAGSSAATREHRDGSGCAPWPRPSSSYISGRDLQDSWAAVVGEAICKKRDAFLMDVMFIHVFFFLPSLVTNGLIIQLSPWHVIFLTGIPHQNVSSLDKDLPEIPKLTFWIKVLWRKQTGNPTTTRKTPRDQAGSL